MQRGGILLAAALMLAIHMPPAAAGEPGAQPDLMIVSRHGKVLNGDDIYNADGLGQQRNVTVDQRTVLLLRMENDGREKQLFTVRASPPTPNFDIRYDFYGKRYEPSVSGFPLFGAEVKRGLSLKVRVVIEPARNAPLGATSAITVRIESDPDLVDAVLIKVTNVSTPD